MNQNEKKEKHTMFLFMTFAKQNALEYRINYIYIRGYTGNF